MHTYKLSKIILFSLVSIIGIIFILFYSILFNSNIEDNNNPIILGFTDIIIITIWILLSISILVSIISAIKSIAKNKNNKTINKIPIQKIKYTTWLFTILLLIITAITGSVSVMTINGNIFNNKFWLRFADMFINTSVLLLTIGIILAMYGTLHLKKIFKLKHKK